MASRAFPALRPTSRSYSPGALPQTEFKALNGATTILRYGNRRVGSELRLGFANIPDARAAQVLALYDQAVAADDWITFSATDGTVGASDELAPYFAEINGSGLRWRFAEPPSVESVVPGVSSLQCRFVGRLDPS